MSEQQFDKGGMVAGAVEVMVIPWANRRDPLPPGSDPRFVIRAEECIVNRDLRCIRLDHPHKEAR